MLSFDGSKRIQTECDTSTFALFVYGQGTVVFAPDHLRREGRLTQGVLDALLVGGGPFNRQLAARPMPTTHHIVNGAS